MELDPGSYLHVYQVLQEILTQQCLKITAYWVKILFIHIWNKQSSNYKANIYQEEASFR